MAINIKNREAEALVAELRAATGKGTSQLILDLLRRAAAEQRARRTDAVAAAVASGERLAQGFAALPVVDPRPADEIVAYDDDGLPR
ncbi:MAG TPA: type II toxin-antitoxin system VapB family antitoxin [Stellaceae bacterium]|jgi:hypothetical protein